MGLGTNATKWAKAAAVDRSRLSKCLLGGEPWRGRGSSLSFHKSQFGTEASMGLCSAAQLLEWPPWYSFEAEGGGS